MSVYITVLKPGDSFEYTSGTPLPTPSGFMVGTYQMETDEGEGFEALIALLAVAATRRWPG